MSRNTHRAARLALASLIATALIAQLAISLSRPDLTIVRFFSLFAVLSNTAAAVMLTLLAGRPGRDRSAGFATFRGAVTVYMTVTLLVYLLVLAPDAVDVGLTEPWIDWTLHVIAPVAVAFDWILSPPATSLQTSTVPMWLIFPAGYLAYTLIRGPIVDWYPYPALDPNGGHGYGAVAMWSAVILVAIFVFGLFYWWWGNRRAIEARSA